MEAHRLSEVTNYIKQVIALNFEDSLWVTAEIAQAKTSGRHVYLELIEKDTASEEIIASVSAVIWHPAYSFIRNKLGDLTNQILQDGTQIQCKVAIEFHPKYGLKFVVKDIDPSYTFGQLEIERQKTVERLQKEGLISKNKERPLPRVLQRLAIISSEKAAGLQDFLSHLNHNPYGYTFRTDLFQASVQGVKQEKELLEQLDNIAVHEKKYDCVVIIRGGGSRLDLSGFDSYNLAEKVALFPLPVITGIGHDIDHNVIEMVANSPMKTPTAAADFIIEHNLLFESSILELDQQLDRLARRLASEKRFELESVFHHINLVTRQNLVNRGNQVEQLDQEIRFQLRIKLKENRQLLDHTAQQIKLANPLELLKKGFTLIYQDSKPVKRGRDIELEKDLDVVFDDGTLKTRPIRFNEQKMEKNK